MAGKKILLEARDLVKEFALEGGKKGKNVVHAVSGVNLRIYEGETLALVGESGCGKSTLGRTLIKLIEATSGTIEFDGTDITRMKDREFTEIRRQMQIIFQDPYASLNPRMNVRKIISEPLTTHGLARTKDEIESQVKALMDEVGIPREFINRYPHQFSGGQRQRIGIARAIALHPRLIICDEPVSALDVSIQAQVLNLMMDLQDSMGLTYMFITHDLSVVRHISTHIAVMYLGQVVEYAPSHQLFDDPKHPYTKALLSAIPIPDLAYRNKKRELIKGEITSPIDPKPGCRFAARCPHAGEKCTQKDLRLTDIGPEHQVACVMYENE
ncbi:ABC transporter ATP-binding protein [Emergencia timonensis]|uniref:ABC transporter ATP-binding protein n=1 Tax=Emergencia timonensis TaxID=1776384 RepID=UPI00241CE55B|nr:oligopeptide/dipeptide ABC transporter ATP-binding protein [Emergencia timonensis]